jgi:plasmid stabilization system protein ParE
MRKIIIKTRARLDLLQIWHFIAADNLEAAIRVEKELEAEIRDLALLPAKGYRRKDVKNSRVRFWVLYSYLISYRYNDESLTVVRVIHGRRAIGKLIRKQD